MYRLFFMLMVISASASVIRLKGSPYERGYQHGSLLKEQIQTNIATFVDTPPSDEPSRTQDFIKSLPELLSFVPQHFHEEMRGLAEGAGVPLQKIILLNLFPEMFHCSAVSVSRDATHNNDLYHVRVLDYAVGKGLQNTAVLQVVEPDIGIPFLNVSYAGFIGTVTGMNLQKISIGEIGGEGYGSWEGVPMAFLLRDILQNAHTLDDVKTMLQTTPRTCEYYYLFCDGKTKESLGVYATASELRFFTPGEDDAQPKDCLLMTSASHPERYLILQERIREHYGSIDEKTLMEIVKRPVSMESNLHNAIFCPSKLKVWIAHAGPNNEPAYTQPYQEWDFLDLLK